jgi:hypothetical protein
LPCAQGFRGVICMATIYNSDNFNLTDWDLDLPINSSGGMINCKFKELAQNQHTNRGV